MNNMETKNMSSNPRVPGFKAGQVKTALLHGMTVEARNGWVIRVNDSDEVEVWPPKGAGFSTHIGLLDRAVADFCRTADMPIPGVNVHPKDQVSVGAPDALLGKDSGEGEGFDNPSINKRPGGLDAEGTDAPDTELGEDTSDQEPEHFDPELNLRPTEPRGTGGLPDTDLGEDMTSRDTNWGDETIPGGKPRQVSSGRRADRVWDQEDPRNMPSPAHGTDWDKKPPKKRVHEPARDWDDPEGLQEEGRTGRRVRRADMWSEMPEEDQAVVQETMQQPGSKTRGFGGALKRELQNIGSSLQVEDQSQDPDQPEGTVLVYGDSGFALVDPFDAVSIVQGLGQGATDDEILKAIGALNEDVQAPARGLSGLEPGEIEWGQALTGRRRARMEAARRRSFHPAQEPKRGPGQVEPESMSGGAFKGKGKPRDVEDPTFEGNPHVKGAFHAVQKPKRGPGQLGVGKAQMGAEAPAAAMGVAARRRAGGTPKYEVVVGNIGTVYSGDDVREAVAAYSEYKEQSESGYGRASGEEVTIFHDGEPWELPMRRGHPSEDDPREGSRRRADSDPFEVTPVEEPGKKPNKGETPSDPDEVVSTSYSKPREEKYETEGETDKIGAREEHDGAYQDPETGEWVTDEEEKNVPQDWEEIAKQPKSKAARITDTYLDPTPDASEIYRNLTAQRPSAALLEDIMDPHKWAANNVFTPARGAQSHKWSPEETPTDQGKMSENRGRGTVRRKLKPAASRLVAGRDVSNLYNRVLSYDEDWRMEAIDESDGDAEDFALMLMEAFPGDYAEEDYLEVAEKLIETDGRYSQEHADVSSWLDRAGSRQADAPKGKGWERVVKDLKDAPGVDNPWALAHSMKNKGDKPKEQGGGKGARRRGSYQGDIETMLDQMKSMNVDRNQFKGLWDQYVNLVNSVPLDANGLPEGGFENIPGATDLHDQISALYQQAQQAQQAPATQMAASRRLAGPSIREKWDEKGAYERNLSSESAEELHALTTALGGGEVDWSKFRPKQPEGAPAEEGGVSEIQAEDGGTPAPMAPAPPAPTARRRTRADAGGEIEAVDEGAKDYWKGYMGDYGKALSEGDTTKKKPEKGRPFPKKKDDEDRKARRQAWLRARRNAQAAAPMAQPAPQANPSAMAPALGTPAPGAAPGGSPAAPKMPGAPGAPGAPPAGLPAGAGDAGLQSLGWTSDDITLMDDEDKKKILQIQLSKPGTKQKKPTMPGAPKPAAPGAPPSGGPGAPPAGPGAGPAPAAPGGAPGGSPFPGSITPPAAARLATLILRKINRRRLLRGQAAPAVPQVQPQVQPNVAPAPQRAPKAPAPQAPGAPAAPAAPGAPAPGAEFAPPAGQGGKTPGAPKNVDTGVPSGDEVTAFKILSEVQGSTVSASTAEQVPALKASIFAQRLLTELGITVSEAYDLFGLSRSKSLTSLFK